MVKKIQVNKQFYELENDKNRYVLFRGGTRSGKTISIIQWLIKVLTTEKDFAIVVGVYNISNSLGTVVSDLEEWLRAFDIMKHIKVKGKPNYTYEYLPTGSSIRFVSTDKAEKWYGLSSSLLWFNEASHIPREVMEQGMMRLDDNHPLNKVIFDFNPTSPIAYVRELENSLLPGGVKTYISDYRDNKALGKKQIQLIESYKDTNWNKWLIFGTGSYAEIRGSIYTNWATVDEFPKEIADYCYAIDFGYANDETALIKVGMMNGEIYVDELIYETQLTNQDICDKFRLLGIDNEEIIADSAEPKSIEEIKRERFRIFPTKKTTIVNGIDILQRYKINITKNSKHIIDEITNYTWKEDKTSGKFYNIPVDGWNHALDGLRYVAVAKYGKKGSGGIKVF